MRRMDMPPFNVRRVATGALAAALLAASGVSVGAQVPRAVEVRQRDSLGARIPMPTRAAIDSIVALMRELNNEAPFSPASAALRRKIDALLPGPGMVTVRKSGVLPKGWVGFYAQGPKHEMVMDDGDFIQYFAYPAIVAVDPESPAQRAGIAPGDVLIAYNGLDVRGREFNLSRLLEPERKLSVTVRRDGETKDYSMLVAKAPERIAQRRLEFEGLPDGPPELERLLRGEDGPRHVMLPGMVPPPPAPGAPAAGVFLPGRSFIFSPSGAFGAALSNVSPQLAKTLNLEQGVLVNDVVENSPAGDAGLRAGDVIVGAADQSVVSIRGLHAAISRHLGDQSVALQVIRDRKKRKLIVRW